MHAAFASETIRQSFVPPKSHRPSVNATFFWEQTAGISVIVSSSAAVASVPFVVLATWLIPPNQATRSWRPWPLRAPYLCFLIAISIMWITMFIMVLKMGTKPDEDPRRGIFLEFAFFIPVVTKYDVLTILGQCVDWTGGLASEGSFIGAEYTSPFIRSPTTNLPPRGLLSMYYDVGTSGGWSQRNNLRRLNAAAAWSATYLPILIPVVYGRLWKCVDDEVKRMDKFHRISRSGGAMAESSLNMAYHSFWLPLSLVQAVWKRNPHWSVAVSSIGLILASVVTPSVVGYIFSWHVYCGCIDTWPTYECWQVLEVDFHWSLVVIILMGVTCVCALALLVMLAWPQLTQSDPATYYGLRHDPSGVAGLLELIDGKTAHDLCFEDGAVTQTLTERDEAMKSVKFKLSFGGTAANGTLEANRVGSSSEMLLGSLSQGIEEGQGVPATVTEPVGTTTNVNLEASRVGPGSAMSQGPGIAASIAKCVDTLWTSIDNSPNTFIFHELVFFLWLGWLLALLVWSIDVALQMQQSVITDQWDYTLPFQSNLYIVAGVFTQVCLEVIFRSSATTIQQYSCLTLCHSPLPTLSMPPFAP